ncbi:MAG: glycoside hydrolase family 9 protein [Candidatus Neomarinimicrobiota bacterium]
MTWKRHGILILVLIAVATLITIPSLTDAAENEVFIRANQVGYRPDEEKVAIAFSTTPLVDQKFDLIEATTGKAVWSSSKIGAGVGTYGNFPYHYLLDFSAVQTPGRYKIRLKTANAFSLPFTIGKNAYAGYQEFIVRYISQQRCGYNPVLDQVCHRKDGRTMYGPMPDSTYIDASGGWHDAADYLRYLMTSGNTVCRLLFAYKQNKTKFIDAVDEWGHSGSNGIPDVLDEAKWGLDWMLKMHPKSDQLFHQVADDRDHIGFKLPFLDTADYGWGKGGYRPVYYATGKPQGLKKFQNTSTGIANLAGRYAAAMAMAYDIWKNDLKDLNYADRCLKAGIEVYEMGLKQPGCQEGTPCTQPYRYYENTWADDMEWGAAELFKVTNQKKYLDEARIFAKMIQSTSWMGADTARHYEFYPFMNMGHYALFEVAEPSFRDTLIGYYRAGIEAVLKRAQSSPYLVGIPFIWCSNHLAAAFVTQCILYEKMTGDKQFRPIMSAHRDWLLGRNPWGVSQFADIPEKEGNTPLYPHSVMTGLNRKITGAMNDGPVYASIYNSLAGIRLVNPDQYAKFQSDLVVYHDDVGDYSTNEPTLDGTAEALFFIVTFGSE